MSGIAVRAACISVVAVVSICTALAAPVTDQGDQAEVGVTFSLSSHAVIQCEPVMLKYTITNHMSDTIEVDFGDNERTAWLGLGCTGPEGSPAQSVKPVRLPRPALDTSSTWIRPEGKHDGAVVVQRLFRTPQTGRYTLHLSANLRWTLKDGRAEQKTVMLSHGLSFDVGPADPERLAAVMRALVNRALGRQREPYRSRYNAIKLLFAIPESEALPAWRHLLAGAVTQRSLSVNRRIIRELVRVGTPAAADLLAEFAWGRYLTSLGGSAGPVLEQLGGPVVRINPGPLLARDARAGLRNMHSTGDSSLKQHVRDLFVTHEGAVP